MNIANTVFAVAFAVSATSAFAGNPVEQYGRQAPAAGSGATVTVSAGCAQGCDVSQVQGRGSFNAAIAARAPVNSSLMSRGVDVSSVQGRA